MRRSRTSPAESEIEAQGGKTKYPYGDERQAGKCDKSGQPDAALEPASASECAGASPPFDGVKDLVGSLAEWEDACPNLLMCSIRGGDGRTTELEQLACDGVGQTSAMIASDAIGFRCCADLPEK